MNFIEIELISIRSIHTNSFTTNFLTKNRKKTFRKKQILLHLRKSQFFSILVGHFSFDQYLIDEVICSPFVCHLFTYLPFCGHHLHRLFFNHLCQTVKQCNHLCQRTDDGKPSDFII